MLNVGGIARTRTWSSWRSEFLEEGDRRMD